MRLDNDRPVEQQTPAPDFFSVLSFGVLCGLGIVSFLFSPLAMLWAHTRMVEPWPKLAAVIGAVVAIAVFNQSPAVVVLSFVYGLVCADTIIRGISRPVGFLRVVAVGMTITTLVIVFLARMENLDPWAFWVRQVSDTVDALAIQWQQSSAEPMDWNAWKQIFIHEGPFQYVALLLLTFWFAVGAGAHFGWTESPNPWSANNLKAMPLLKSASFVFLGLFVVVAFRIIPGLSGLLGIGRAWMFVQGSVVLSKWLGLRNLTRPQKTLAYCLGIFPGFYALIGLGVIGPWLVGPWFKLRSGLKEKT